MEYEFKGSDEVVARAMEAAIRWANIRAIATWIAFAAVTCTLIVRCT